LYFELFDNFERDFNDPLINKDGIEISIYDPSDSVIEKLVIVSESHKSYQKVIENSGTYKVCVKGSIRLWRKNPEAKYEMHLQLEPIQDHLQLHNRNSSNSSRLVSKE
jgi:hypothetical protein